MSLAEQLQRPHLKTLVPYASARRSMSGGSVWLNANESPYAYDYTLDCSQLNRYPSFQSQRLNQAYADYANVRLEQVLSCRGSDEAIELLIKAFCEPKQDRVLICPPTYGMYAISAQTHGADVVSVPLTSSYQLDLDAIKARSADARLIFLCSPSNPVGNRLAQEDIEAVLKFATTSLVVVDEAYIEFCAEASVVDWLAKYPNLVVLRTLSKAFALAGARCGFALANEDVITVLQKVLAPYPLPDLTIQIASQALSPVGIERVQADVTRTVKQRQRIRDELAELPMALVAESETNFLLYRVADAESLMQTMQQNGILIRNQSAQVGLDNTIRISVGNERENTLVIDALKRFFGDIQ